MNSENVGTWHGIIVSPALHVQRVERVTAKTGQSLSEYQGFGQELICYTGTSMFYKLF